MYKRQAHDNPDQLASYVLKEIKSLGNNKYQIIEQENGNKLIIFKITECVEKLKGIMG